MRIYVRELTCGRVEVPEGIDEVARLHHRREGGGAREARLPGVGLIHRMADAIEVAADQAKAVLRQLACHVVKKASLTCVGGIHTKDRQVVPTKVKVNAHQPPVTVDGGWSVRQGRNRTTRFDQNSNTTSMPTARADVLDSVVGQARAAASLQGRSQGVRIRQLDLLQANDIWTAANSRQHMQQSRHLQRAAQAVDIHRQQAEAALLGCHLPGCRRFGSWPLAQLPRGAGVF